MFRSDGWICGQQFQRERGRGASGSGPWNLHAPDRQYDKKSDDLDTTNCCRNPASTPLNDGLYDGKQSRGSRYGDRWFCRTDPNSDIDGIQSGNFAQDRALASCRAGFDQPGCLLRDAQKRLDPFRGYASENRQVSPGEEVRQREFPGQGRLRCMDADLIFWEWIWVRIRSDCAHRLTGI